MPGDLQFADPWLLALLPLAPLLAFVAWRRGRRPRGGLVLATVRPMVGLAPGWRARWRPAPLALQALAVALLVVALARPRTVEADARVETRGIDIVLAFDISGSMQDAGLGARTKMDAAKRALTEFIEGRENDRIGLVVFKSESRIMAPLTLDYRALQRQIADVERQNEGLQDGTAIGKGIADAASLLRNSPSKSRVIILATDGQNNDNAVPPEQAAAIAETLKIRLYTIGIPTANQRPESSLDERAMRAYSERTGGSYARASSVEDLRGIYETVADLETSRFERLRFIRYTELGNYFLLPGVALLLVGVALGATLFRTAP